MKTLSLTLLLAISLTGCSHSPKTSRAERAYYKYLKHAQVARQERHRLFEHHRNEKSSRPAAPPLEQNVQPESATASSSEQ